jgi:hypothetical protein
VSLSVLYPTRFWCFRLGLASGSAYLSRDKQRDRRSADFAQAASAKKVGSHAATLGHTTSALASRTRRSRRSHQVTSLIAYLFQLYATPLLREGTHCDGSPSAQSHEAEAEFQDCAPQYALSGQFQATLGHLNLLQ